MILLNIPCVCVSIGMHDSRGLRSVHNIMTLHHMLRCVAFTLTLVATQHNARIDLDPILAFLCVVSLHLIALNYEYLRFAN